MSAKLYVLTADQTEHLQLKLGLLEKNGYRPHLFNDTEALIKAFKHTRVPIIVIDDQRGKSAVLDDIKKLSGEPEFSGVRFIIQSAENETAIRAVQYNFRDLIALDLPDGLWLERFQFAGSGNKIHVEMPPCQLVYGDLSAIKVPGRITMLTESHVWLETPVDIKKGEVLSITGPLPENFGLKSINLTVESNYRQGLYFRFSQGLMCRWSVGEALHTRKVELLSRLRQSGQKALIKGYVGIKSRELRSEMIAQMRALDMMVYPALNMNSLGKEPAIVRPHLIIIDDQIMLSPGFKSTFALTLKQLAADTRVFVLARPETTQMIKELGLGGPFVICSSPSQIPLRQMVEDLQKSEREKNTKDIVYVHKGHPLSHINVTISARLVQIHPLCAQFALPIPLHKFSLAIIDVPFLKKTVGTSFVAKIINCYEHVDPNSKEFPFIIDCTLSGLTRFQREAIGNRMLETIDTKIPHGSLSLNQIRQIEQQWAEQTQRSQKAPPKGS